MKAYVVLFTFMAASPLMVHAAITDDILRSPGSVSSSSSSSSDTQKANTNLSVPAEATGQQAQASTNLKSNSVITLDQNSGLSMGNNQPITMFGAQLFRGSFASSSGSAFNKGYVINPGDNIQLRLWGAYQFSGNLTVDPQGNIFIPNVGPLKVSGTKNGELQRLVEQNVRKVYVSNVGVYAGLEEAQPVKVLVTGFVTQPGSYGGVSSDSILAYLDRAGGVDTSRGSYVDIEIRRDGKVAQRVNLYNFLLAGSLQPFSFQDGDIIVVAPRKHTFSISGEVYNAYDFEFDVPELTIGRALDVARVRPGATHVSISRKQGTRYSSEYYPIASSSNVVLQDGDTLTVTSDRYPGTIQVRVEGAHSGEHAIVLPYGAKLSQVMSQIRPSALSDVNSVQLFRTSVATRQKEMLNVSLDKLEEATLSVRSATIEEANLRKSDADLVKQFIERARKVVPKGQVIVNRNNWNTLVLEQGDVLIIPERTSVVMVHGEVMFANAIAWQPNQKAKEYINEVGGYTQKSNTSKLIVIHQNGEAELVKPNYVVAQGDEIMVLPKITSKGVEIARGLTQILYQIAIASKVILDL